MENTGRIALVTGANKGIGFEVARGLGRAGHTVLLGSRDAANGERAAETLRGEGLDARAITIDLNDEATIAAAAKRIEDEFGRLDVLVNNAGIATPGDGTPGEVETDVLRRTFETNFFGTHAVTRVMVPLVRRSDAGRIVNVSSGLGSLTQNGDPEWEHAGVKPLGYNASKAALNMMTVQLAWELRDTGIRVNSADPGYTATDLNGNSGTQTIEEGAAETLRLALLPDNGPTGGYFATEGPVPW